MNIKSPEDFFANELRDIYSAEKLLTRALPRLSKAVHTDSVRERLQERVEQGRVLLESMDQVFDELEVSKGRQKNQAIEGLIEDAQELSDSIKNEKVLDTALIGAVQKIEHYCIAAWGTAAALGRTLGHQSAVEAFERALEQGKSFDKQMTELAESEINPAMLEGDEQTEKKSAKGKAAH